MAVGPGLTLPQLAVDSSLRSQRDHYFGPIAATTNHVVASVDPSSVAVGANFTLASAVDGKKLRRARRITMTINDDDAGGGLNVRALVKGQRWGMDVQEFLEATSADTNDTTVTSVNVFDQVLSITMIAKTADSGDAVFFGIDGTSFGLDKPIDNVEDVYSIVNVSTNTEASPTAISSTTVVAGAPTGGSVAGGSYIKGITLATTDRWEVCYQSSRRVDMNGVIGVNR